MIPLVTMAAGAEGGGAALPMEAPVLDAADVRLLFPAEGIAAVSEAALFGAVAGSGSGQAGSGAVAGPAAPLVVLGVEEAAPVVGQVVRDGVPDRVEQGERAELCDGFGLWALWADALIVPSRPVLPEVMGSEEVVGASDPVQGAEPEREERAGPFDGVDGIAGCGAVAAVSGLAVSNITAEGAVKARAVALEGKRVGDVQSEDGRYLSRPVMAVGRSALSPLFGLNGQDERKVRAALGGSDPEGDGASAAALGASVAAVAAGAVDGTIPPRMEATMQTREGGSVQGPEKRMDLADAIDRVEVVARRGLTEGALTAVHPDSVASRDREVRTGPLSSVAASVVTGPAGIVMPLGSTDAAIPEERPESGRDLAEAAVEGVAKADGAGRALAGGFGQKVPFPEDVRFRVPERGQVEVEPERPVMPERHEAERLTGTAGRVSLVEVAFAPPVAAGDGDRAPPLPVEAVAAAAGIFGGGVAGSAPVTPSHPHLYAAERPATLPPSVPAALVAQAHMGEAGPVTVTLKPEELGTLRFEMHARGEAIHVALVVERPETLDLLRRHAEQLVGEFRQAGFAGASFSFSGGSTGGSTGGGAERWAGRDYLPPEGDVEPVPQRPKAGRGSGLNLLV